MRRRNFRILLIVGVLIGAIATPVIASHLLSPASVSGPVPLGSGNGLVVTLEGDTDIQLDDFTDGSDTIVLTTEHGNATVQASGTATASMHATEITGQWTNVTGIDAASNSVTIDPEDKQSVTVGGDIQTFNWTADSTFAVDDNQPDFVYSGPSGTSSVTVGGVPAGETIAAVDADTRTVLDVATSDASGTVTFSSLDNSEHTVELHTGDSTPGLSNPQPEGPQSGYPTTLSIDVSDNDFPNDEVTVDFYLDGSLVGSDTVTSDGPASTSISEPDLGGHTVRAEAEDQYGNTNTREWTFGTPNNLTIRNATAPYSVMDDRTVDVTLYQDDTIIERSTTDGNISLEGLDTSEQIVAEAEAPGYNDSYIVIGDITQQSTLYMRNDSLDSVTVRFVLNDQTGGVFSENAATLYIQKPIDRTGTTEWKTIHADEFGVEGVTTGLEEGQRYRLIVKNDQGDQRMLGSYTADVSETRELTVGAVNGELGENDPDYLIDGNYLNETSGRYVQFKFNDSDDITDSVVVKIHERGNASNVLMANTTFGGPLGTIGLSEPIPEAQNDTDWVIKAWVDRGGNVTAHTIPVGPQRPVLDGMPWWLKVIISIGSIWIVAGLFSQLNGDVGALVVAGLGGMFWFVDFLPDGTGFGVVMLSMLTAAVIFINERRGGGL